MPVISTSGATEYTPLSLRVKRAFGFAPTPKDINLPVEGASPGEIGRKIGKGLKQVRELSRGRSPSKR